MAEMNKQDMDILEYYATNKNRELYWNYLAQHAGNDGYGLLALGVVRNDSMPGAVANHFAQNHARSHDGITLSERGWEDFGADLVQQDLLRRTYYMNHHRPDLAVNLPVKDVQAAHDQSFQNQGIDPNAWTPRQLLEAARRQGGDPEAGKVWHSMLDNSVLGIGRGGVTLADIARYDDAQLPALRYTGALIGAGTIASQDRANVDPNVIGGTEFYYMRDKSGTWSAASAGTMGAPSMRTVTDTHTISELEDARSVRLERQHKATQFHPLDPHRDIARSPVTLADAASPLHDTAENRTLAVAGQNAMKDPRDPAHPDHALHAQLRLAVEKLDAANGRTFDDTSERIAASLLPLAKQHGINRVDHVVLGRQTADLPAGRNIFVVQGRLDDPAMLRASTTTEQAARTPVSESFQRAETLSTAQGAQSQTQTPQTAAIDGPSTQRVSQDAPVRSI